MTNSVYFHAVRRDAYSTCSSSSSLQSPETSQRDKSTIKSRVKGFRVSSFLGFKQKVVSNDGKELPRPIFQSSHLKNESIEEIEFDRTSSWYLDDREFSPPSFYTSNFKNFSLKELRTATGNLLTEDILSVDGCDREFKGWISEHDLTPTEPENGIAVVVKFLAWRTFGHCEEEARYLGNLSHPNLVKFFGNCLNEGRLYVFEFLPHTLGDYLFECASLLLPWSLRMKVALGVAKGLAFLHRAQVVYREFSTSNIYLDTNYNPKLSDFGFPKDCLSGDWSRAAPGYLATGYQTAKIDVYSFGILLLEMITGRQSSEFDDHDNTRLATPNPYKNLAGEVIKEPPMVKCLMRYLDDANISHIIDHRLEGRYSLKSAQKVANLSFKCLATEASIRPDMDQAVAELEQLQDSKYTKYMECEEKAMGEYKKFIECEMKLMEDELNMAALTEKESTERQNEWDLVDEGDMAALIEEERDSLLLDGR